MPEIFLALPSYYNKIVCRLRECDWLIHNFHDSDQNQVYNPAGYLFNQEFEDARYFACIDLNILQYAVNCVKKNYSNEHFRNACSMLIFCRLANIEIESGLAMYERINHGIGDVEEALDDLAILRALDSADPNLLAEYMLGNQLVLRDLEIPAIDRGEVRDGLTRYKRLIDWDSIYVLILGAVSFHLDDNVAAPCKFEHFLDWMIREFRLSLPVLVYAIRLFGKMPLSGMMKFKLTQLESERKRALANMTWDLFFVDRYFKNWVDPQKTREEVVFTQDRVDKELLRMAINVQYAETVDPLLHYLRESQSYRCKELLDSASQRDDRVYLTKDWNPEYRAKLIRSFEKDLGILTEEA